MLEFDLSRRRFALEMAVEVAKHCGNGDAGIIVVNAEKFAVFLGEKGVAVEREKADPPRRRQRKAAA